MPREAGLFEAAGGSVVEGHLLVKQSRKNIPPNWIDRDDAIRQTARHLGFRRTGASIAKAVRSVINSALRCGELAREAGMIRRRTAE